LGGLGPDFNKTEEIRYENVGEFDGENFDLVVEVAPGSIYVPKSTDSNGLNGQFGQINLHVGESVDLTFTMLDKAGDPLNLKSFYFSFFDLDEGANNHESLCIDDGEYHSINMVDNNHEIDISRSITSCRGRSGVSSTMFTSNSRGFLCDNPTLPLDLGVVTCADCAQCTEGGFNSEYFPVKS
jgi:hypothetical protein